jgi:hypothetical protein
VLRSADLLRRPVVLRSAELLRRSFVRLQQLLPAIVLRRFAAEHPVRLAFLLLPAELRLPHDLVRLWP